MAKRKAPAEKIAKRRVELGLNDCKLRKFLPELSAVAMKKDPRKRSVGG